jgi:hypothetical protein
MKKVVLLLISCIVAGQIVAQNDKALKLRNLSVGYEDHFENATTRNEGKLFELPDTNSNVIWQHKHEFQTQIIPLRKAESQGFKWYQVSAYDTIIGFIREQDFVKYKFYGKNYTYYYVFNDPRPKDKNYPFYRIIKRKYRPKNQVLTEKQKQQKLTDTFELGMKVHYLRATNDYQKVALPNVDHMLTFEFFRASCPGTNITQLVVDCGDSLTTLTSSFGMGEAGWSENIIPYIPIKFGSGKILLVANGDVKNIFDTYRAKLNTFDCPKNIGIPIEELVVVVKENYEPIEADRQDAESYRDPETKRTLYVEEYYRWKDNKLVLVKTIKK